MQNRTGSLSCSVLFWCAAANAMPVQAQETTEVRGRVVDDHSGEEVVGAMIRLGQSPEYGISDPWGRFRIQLDGSSPAVLVVTAPGFAKRYQPVEPEMSGDVEVRLSPDPIQLQGFDVELQNFRTRLKRRRNRITWNYALEGELLSGSDAANVWDLVGKLQNFHFEGFTNYGCTTARIFGDVTTVGLYIDERPVRMGIFQQYRPEEFALVEVFNFGSGIHAYTQKYLTWMTENDHPPPAFETLAQQCPSPKPEPGARKRGRPVGPL